MWILVHDPESSKPFLCNPDTGAWIDVNPDTELVHISCGQLNSPVRESLSELAQMLGAVGMGECPVCEGSGIIVNWVATDKFCPDKVEETCSHCSGTGRGVGPVKEVK